MVEVEDVDAATGASGVKDDGLGSARLLLRQHLPVDEGVVSDELVGGGRRHHVEDEGDEEERDRHHEQCRSEPVDLVGEGLRWPVRFGILLKGSNSGEWWSAACEGGEFQVAWPSRSSAEEGDR